MSPWRIELEGRSFVQDSTGGVFVNNETEPGRFRATWFKSVAPPHRWIRSGHYPAAWKKFGTAPLPETQAISVDRSWAG